MKVEGLSHRETESVRGREGAVPKTGSIREHLFEEKYNKAKKSEGFQLFSNRKNKIAERRTQTAED